MTEAEWNTCTDAQAMLWFLHGKADDRKLRLFAVACCRAIGHLLRDNRSRNAVEVAERYADKAAAMTELTEAQQAAYMVMTETAGVQSFAASAAASASAPVAGAAGWWVEEPENTRDANWVAALIAGRQTATVARLLGNAGEVQRQCSSVRCIFGPLPYRPVVVGLHCRTAPVTTLAEVIYTDRAFDRLPILADALEDAGCHDAAILEHCRGGGEHARGCWVVDLLLGKE